MVYQILTLFLLSAFWTTARSSENEDLGKNSLESDRRQQMNNSSLLKVKSRGARADNGCWQIKYYYRNGSYSDVFFYTDFDDTLQTDFDCTDGCIYMRLGDNDGSRHCFVDSSDVIDEVKDEYTIPPPDCPVSSRGF